MTGVWIWSTKSVLVPNSYTDWYLSVWSAWKDLRRVRTVVFRFIFFFFKEFYTNIRNILSKMVIKNMEERTVEPEPMVSLKKRQWRPIGTKCVSQVSCKRTVPDTGVWFRKHQNRLVFEQRSVAAALLIILCRQRACSARWRCVWLQPVQPARDAQGGSYSERILNKLGKWIIQILGKIGLKLFEQSFASLYGSGLVVEQEENAALPAPLGGCRQTGGSFVRGHPLHGMSGQDALT